nr:hydroxyacid oxidase 1 [Leptinotarsa decemlineata]
MSNLVSIKEFEEHAYRVLPRNTLDYYRSGAGQQLTLKQNREAFSRYKIRPRFLRNVEHRDLSTTVLGERISMPIGISPTAMQRMAHPDGECANVQAAQALGTIFTLSTLSNSSIEEVAQAAPHAIKWYQLYIYKDREVTKQLVERAERAGFKALVLTVDAPLFGIRLADVKNKFSLPPHLSLANFQGGKSTDINRKSEEGSGLNTYSMSLFDPTLEWRDIHWLKSITRLPIVLKGILTAEDALLGAEAGVAAILVSNHGARQVDGTPASVEALPEIVKAVGDRVEVYMDGGITDGTDVFKALGLGAKMVFVGRPALWGLAHSGEEGVKKVMNILKTEFDIALGLSGCTKISDIKPDMVVHESFYSKI